MLWYIPKTTLRGHSMDTGSRVRTGTPTLSCESGPGFNLSWHRRGRENHMSHQPKRGSNLSVLGEGMEDCWGEHCAKRGFFDDSWSRWP